MNISMDEIYKQMEADRQKAAQESEDTRKELRTKLMKLMVKKVIIEFYGSGDSGSIEQVIIEYVDENKALSEKDEEELRKELEAYAYKYLESTGVDWYNNDGGQGEIVFDLSTVPLKFSANVDVNYTESRTAHEVEEIL